MTPKEARETVRKYYGEMTNDYVKREDAIERCDYVRAAVSYITEHRFSAVAYSCRKEIEAIPADSDVVKVVRCQNCKHSEPWYADKSRCFLWHESGIAVFNDGFCNYGKEKENK